MRTFILINAYICMYKTKAKQLIIINNQLLSFNNGGEGGIRTLDRDKPIHTFQACAFGRSATSPDSLKVSHIHLFQGRARLN